MKARTRKTRWLLMTLLLGFLAAAGVTFALHQHSGKLLASARGIVPADDTSLQQSDTTAPVSIGDDLPAQGPAASAARGDTDTVADPHSSSAQTDTDKDSGLAPYGGASYTAGAGGGAQQESNAPSSSGDGTHPQKTAGYLANNGYVAFDCGGLPGCGAGGAGLNGGAYWRHHSPGSGSDPQTNDPGPTANNPGQTNNSNPGDPGAGDPGQKSNPPGSGSNPPGPGSDPSGSGSGHSAAAAPELDPATLGGALTLLLGSLAIVGSRRVRATR